MSFECDLCSEMFLSEKQHKKHLESKQHLINLERLQNQEKKIFVSGFARSATMAELTTYFSQFGKVDSVFLNKHKGAFAFVTFVSEDVAKTVLESSHSLKQRQLIVKKFNGHGTQKKSQHFISNENIIERIKECKSVAEQVDIFCRMTSLSQADIDMRNQIRIDVEEALREYYPNCDVCIYGSTLNGYGMKGSDVDLLFIPSPKFWDQHNNEEAIDKKQTPNISISDIEEGTVSKDILESQHPSFQVLFIGKALRKCSEKFMRVFHIPARCPIVKLTHRNFFQQCDISCSNRVVLQNSHLLRFYCDLDKRVKPMMMVLRYWAKFVGIVRLGNLSSYAFSLLVIFFLQSTKPSVLPSVEYLKSKAGFNENPKDSLFLNDPDVIERSSNDQPVDELILAFFEHYGEFDFSRSVISPLHGKPLSRESLELPADSREQHFKNCSICIQDPLEPSRNITSYLTINALLVIKNGMKMASMTFQASLLPTNSASGWGLMNLFRNVNSLERPLTHVPCENMVPITKSAVTITLLFRKNLKISLSDCSPRGLLWLNAVLSGVIDIFKHGLCLETELIDSSERLSFMGEPIKRLPKSDSELPAAEVQKHRTDKDTLMEKGQNSLESSNGSDNGCQPDTNGKSDDVDSEDLYPEHCDPEMLFSFQCIGEFNTWYGRQKQKKKTLSNEQQYLLESDGQYGREKAVSLTMLTESFKLNKPLYFTCDCYYYRESYRDRLMLALIPCSPSDDFLALSAYLKGFVPELLNQSLRFHQ